MKRKRRLIKYNLDLNEEQKEAEKIISKNPVNIVAGQAGSGKTLLACKMALDAYYNKEVHKIIISRPIVGNNLGFLPGDIKEKMDPWLQPIYHNLYALQSKPDIEKIIQKGDIEIIPFDFMRGRTFCNAFVIIDECQNVSEEEAVKALTRLGLYSKIIMCGDESQIDLKRKGDSSMKSLLTMGASVPGVSSMVLETNHRHPIITDILKYYGKK